MEWTRKKKTYLVLGSKPWNRRAFDETLPQAPVREVHSFEVPASTKGAFRQLEPSSDPNVFLDVSHTTEANIAAIECCESEADKFSHPRTPEALRATATQWGRVVGCAAVGACEPVRSVRLQAN